MATKAMIEKNFNNKKEVYKKDIEELYGLLKTCTYYDCYDSMKKIEELVLKMRDKQ